MNDDAHRTPEGVPVTAVTADEMRAVDRVATEEYGLPLRSMMENAGRALAAVVRETATVPVVVLAGAGGNGGGGLAAARHLRNRGVAVRVVLSRDPDTFHGAPAMHLGVLESMGVDVVPATTVDGPTADLVAGTADSVVVDALVGYGLTGALRGESAALVDALATRDGPVVSLDVTSGLDATTGARPGPAVRPDRVLTLALPKTGLRAVAAPLQLADIGIPAGVYADLDIPYERPFDADRVELTAVAG
jgi:NAD(P)H-hydrate epimerase